MNVLDTLDEGFRALGTAEVHDVDEGRHTVAVDFPHEVMDSYRTDWGRGCWDESFAKRLPVMLANHNPDHLIGHAIGSESLGDRSRLVGQFSNFADVPKAKEMFAHVRDGDIPGWSFHYVRGQTVQHPNVRNARRYTKADMLEFSPVVFPSIPGAQAVGLRSLEAVLEIPSLEVIMKMKEDGIIGDDGVRALIEEHHPLLREHITIGTRTELTPQEKIDAILAEHAPDLAESFRAMTITIGDDGSVSTDSGAGGATSDDGTVTNDGADDPTVLIQAIDAALDHASASVADVDVTTLPDSVQQALALMQAAGVAVDELQEVLGISDPDDPLEGNRAEKVSDAPWNFDASKYTPEQLRSAALVVDGDGSTKDMCHLPVKEPDGTLNRAGIHAAAGALDGARGGTKLSDADKKAAANKLMGLYSTLGEKPPAGVLKLAGTGSRSDEGESVDDATLERTLDTLNRRVA